MKVNLRSGGVWWEFISLSLTNSSSKMVFEYNLSSNCMSIYLPILSYYLVGICYFHWNLNWSILDSILITTGSMTAGKDIFTHSHYTRIFFSLFIIIGALLLLNLLSSLIITEVRSARDLIKKSAVSPLLKTEITDRSAYIRRLLYPLIVVAVVLITGTLYFAYSEGWTFTDSMYFCIVLRSITGSDGIHMLCFS